MGLWTLLEGFLLLANAFAILNEDRFLAPRGWSFSEFSVGRTKSLKGQLIGCRISNKDCRMRCKCSWCLKRFFSHKINQHSWSLADRTVKNISFYKGRGMRFRKSKT